MTISGTGTKSNTVADNFIGTNNAGTAALPNTSAGISIFGGAQSNIIGGPTAASRNIISGNAFQGITISDSGTRSNQVLSNYVGLNAAGTAAIPNQSSGIDIFNAATSNVIGDAGKGNVISGNLAYGMSLSVTGTSMNTVKANLIGLNATATVGIGNAFSGVALLTVQGVTRLAARERETRLPSTEPLDSTLVSMSSITRLSETTSTLIRSSRITNSASISKAVAKTGLVSLPTIQGMPITARTSSRIIPFLLLLTARP